MTFFELISSIWDKKIKIAEINKNIEFKKIAHEVAHGIAMTKKDNEVIGQPLRLYKENYEKEYTIAIKRLLET